MNSRFAELAKTAGLMQSELDCKTDEIEKFGEAIVRECVRLAHSVATQPGSSDDMVYGADQAAGLICRHFDVR